MRGFVEIYKNGELVESGSNTISILLNGAVIDNLSVFDDYALDNLFTQESVDTGGTQDGFDGIQVEYGTNNLSLITELLSADNTSIKWRGEMVNNTGASFSNADMSIGHNYGAGIPFGLTYASYQDIPTIEIGDTLIINWTITIS